MISPVSFDLFYNMATRKANVTGVPVGSSEKSWSRLTQRPQSLCPWIRARPLALLHSHGCSLVVAQAGPDQTRGRSLTGDPPRSGVKGLGVTPWQLRVLESALPVGCGRVRVVRLEASWGWGSDLRPHPALRRPCQPVRKRKNSCDKTKARFLPPGLFMKAWSQGLSIAPNYSK